jgi:hypothetical protein
MRSIVALSVSLAACGASQSPSPAVPVATENVAGAAASDEWTGRARDALARGDLDRTIFAAENALRLDRADEEALEIAALVGLARRTPGEVLSLLRGQAAPKFVKLRARAALIERDYEALARELGSLSESDHDVWSREMRNVASAMGTHAAYETTMRNRALRYVSRDTPSYSGPPVIGVVIGGATYPAIVVTNTYLSIVDTSLRNEAGRLDALDFTDGPEGQPIRNVPFVSTDLSGMMTTMGPAKMVLGLDFLLATHATLDGPEGRLVLGSTCEAVGCGAGTSQTLPLVTMNGTMPLIEARAENAEGFFLINTAASAPVSVLESVATALGRNAAELSQGGSPVPFTLETFTLAQTALEGVPAFAAGVPEALSTQARVPVIGIVGAPLLRPFVVRFDEETRTLSMAVR